MATQEIMKFGGKAIRTVIALILVITGAFVAVQAIDPGKAHATESANLEVGGTIFYAGWGTNWMHVDGSMAYCGNPAATTPAAGSYEKAAVDAPSGRTSETVADLWFGYGSPGFDASMFPSTWYDGTAMDDGRYAALTHIIASDTFASNGDYALYGCSQDFKDWARSEVIGFGASGQEINPNATGRQMCARMGEVPSNFHAFMLYTGTTTQLVLSFSYVPYGSIELTKASSNPAISEGNDCYSVAGAVYSIYSDAACTVHVADITTDDNGYKKIDEIVPGNYFVVETTPAQGFALDSTVYPVTVEPGQTAKVNGGTVFDIPQSDPVGMLVAKVDATTGKASPQGSGTLAGAQFTVSYYSGLFDSADAAEASEKLKNTWVFATDTDGFAYYEDEYKVAGDEIYRMTNGDSAIPLGTVVIEETKAPVGYNLDDGFGNAPKKFVVQITSDDTTGEAISTFNSPTAPDTIQRGDYRLVKEVATTIYSNGDGDMPQEVKRVLVPGVQFQLINDSDHAIVSPETGAEVAQGGIVCTITTDENGLATTKAIDLPQGWDGALAYGTYKVHEVIPPAVADAFKAEYGSELVPVDDWKVTISAQDQYDAPVLVNNRIPQTPLKVVKVDAETGVQIPLTCSFKLMDAENNLVTYTSHYPDEQVMDTWVTNASGEVTLPMLLEQGTYTLVEVQAPEGYVLNTEGMQVVVGSDYRGWDDAIVVTFTDAPIHAKIQIMKVDGETELPVEGAEYCVKAEGDVVTGDGTVRFKDGQVVGYVTTDEKGEAVIEGLYLGNYVVFETKSPEGWALDTSEHHLCIESQGQLVPVVVSSLALADAPTTLEILKVDSLDETKVLSGATFNITQTSSAVLDELDPGFNVAWEVEVTTGENGIAQLPYLPHGTFEITEVKAPDHYYMTEDAEPISFKVDEQGFIGLDQEDAQFSDVLALTFENTPTILDVSKTDITTEDELPGATLVVADMEGNVIEEWVSTNKPHRIVGIVPGNYVLTETIAPEGYMVATSVDFTAEDTGKVQSVEMKDDYTKVDFSKTDIANGKDLHGAHLQVIGDDGKVVAEWDTDGKPHRINGLEPGDYMLRETFAPDGYEIAEDVNFTVKATGDIQKVEMKDRATPAPETPSSTMPQTGDSVPWWTFIAIAGGAASIAVGLAAGRRLHNKKDVVEDEGSEQ